MGEVCVGIEMFRGRLHTVIRWPRAVLDWLCAGRSDYRAFQVRRRSRSYRLRLGWCKNLWIGAGVVTMINPTVSFAVPVVLAMVFLTFAVLDEMDSMS